MKLELYNDLHLEFGAPLPAFRGGEVLCIAGDLVDWKNRHLGVEVLNNAGRIYDRVFFVLGNHEFYGGNEFDEVKAFWFFQAEFEKNVTMLRRGMLEVHEGINFGGDTLWTDINPVQQNLMPIYMNDCVRCYGLTGQRVAHENAETWKFLNEYTPDVVITHHLPTEVMITERWRGKPANEYFANTYGKAERIGAKLWHFGHTHDTIDMVHEGTRYVCNPYGYHNYAVNDKFENYKVVEV